MLCYLQEKPLPIAQTWEMQSQFQYVLRSHGAGLDSHRTWNALILSCVPVFKSSSINDLFSDHPVIIVDDWQEIEFQKTLHAPLEIEHQRTITSILK